MEPAWVESQQQLQRQNTETHVSQRMGFYRGTAGSKARKVRIRSWDVWNAQGNTEGSETEGKIKEL